MKTEVRTTMTKAWNLFRERVVVKHLDTLEPFRLLLLVPNSSAPFLRTRACRLLMKYYEGFEINEVAIRIEDAISEQIT